MDAIGGDRHGYGHADQPREPGRERDKALALALRFLNRRERSVAEMVTHLTDREVRAEVVESVVDELRAEGYLDDARYARLFTHDRRELDGWGRERIERSLRERGIDRELVARALAEEAHEDELARATALLEHRFPEPPADHREHERALGVLIRKGFDSELALDALRQYGRRRGDRASG